MKPLNSLIAELREKRLWPVAAVLLACLVAVPVLLAKSSSTPSTVASLPASPATPTSGMPQVTVDGKATRLTVSGKARDPFAQQKLPAPATTGTTGVTTGSGTTASTGSSTTTGSGGTSAGNTGAGATGSSATTGNGSTGTGTTGGGLPTNKPKPAPAGLTATEAYHVTLGITNASGGLDTIDPLTRLAPLPSSQRPLLVEMGVLGGGHRVLFVVLPGTVVSGAGRCIPGPVDCELLSLAPGGIESLSVRTSSGVSPVAQFAVTGLSADKYSSAAAAMRARKVESSAGRRLLDQSTLSALSLFRYDAGSGTVADLRTLTVGGN
jgi:hypothetical protein